VDVAPINAKDSQFPRVDYQQRAGGLERG